MLLKNGRTLKIPEGYDKLKHTVPLSHIDKEIGYAMDAVIEETTGEQLGLFCRYNNINIAMSKYFRFEEFNLIAGISGAGKSYLLNILLQDFLDKDLNSGFKQDVIILHFGYEMSSKKELIRSVSSKMKKSYSYLLSSQYDKGKKTYNKLSNAEVELVKRNLDEMKGKPFYFSKDTGSLSQMYYSIYEMANKFPNAKIVVSNDHTLLIKRSRFDSNEIELLANAAKKAIQMRDDFGALILFLGQLNANITSIDRLNNNKLHYPIRTDIHGSNQVYQALDNCFILHRPELLNIKRYSEDDLSTDKLAHIAYIKSRNGEPYNLFYEADLGHGGFIERNINYFADKMDFT